MNEYSKRVSAWIALLLILALSGCVAEKQTVERKVPEKLQVTFTAAPPSPEVNKEVTFSVAVTQGKENVNDADDVKFEIWREGQKDNHMLVRGKKIGDGVYSARQRFDKPGTYYVMYHIDARGLHSMTNNKIEVR